MTSSSSSPRGNAPWPSRTGTRSALTGDEAAAPCAGRPSSRRAAAAAPDPAIARSILGRPRLLLRRGLGAAARARACRRVRRAGVVGDLQLVGLGHALEHLDLDAVR